MSVFESIQVGEEYPVGSHRFEAEAIKRFARDFDPQAFHLDEEIAARSLLGGLCASGWHTAAVAMRCNVDAQVRRLKAHAAAGGTMPRLGPSPGVRNIRWPRPVHAGDTIDFFQTVTDKRISKSRAGWGVVEFAMRGQNQRGEDVYGFEGSVFVSLD